MSNRTSACYQAVFKFIEKKQFKLRPDEIISDFETGLRHAIRAKFPDVRLRGCWYHYCAAIRKKLLSYGLNRLFKSDHQAALIKRALMNLPLLPAVNFIEGYQQVKRLIDQRGLFSHFKSFLAYFERYWIHQVWFFNVVGPTIFVQFHFASRSVP